MTDTTEQKAMVRVNEVLTERGWSPHLTFSRHECSRTEALCRAIEQLEAEKAARAADRQEVRDAVAKLIELFKADSPARKAVKTIFDFIISKPDPLVEVFDECFHQEAREGETWSEAMARNFRAAMKKCGCKIEEEW